LIGIIQEVLQEFRAWLLFTIFGRAIDCYIVIGAINRFLGLAVINDDEVAVPLK
jgi:hypothetical protein